MSHFEAEAEKYQEGVSRAQREMLHGHSGLMVLLTGLSASGKSTVAKLVETELHLRGYSTYLLDGDVVRKGLCSDLQFSDQDRKENIRRVGRVACLFVDAGLVVLCSLIAPFESDRRGMREGLLAHQFIEVYLNCPLEVCAARDPKGLYAKASQGLVPHFTGISSPYEPPSSPDVELLTHLQKPRESADQLINYVERRLSMHLLLEKGQISRSLLQGGLATG